MKVVILAGGFGTRLSEYTESIPKPMVKIGDKPILWHIMEHYSQFGHNDFLLALGYKADIVKEYFLNYRALNADFTVELGTGKINTHHFEELDWKVTLVDTGLNTMTGGRVKRMKKFIGNETFLLTYGDGLSNVNIDSLINFHKSHGKLITMTAVRPAARFGELEIDNDRVISFEEKPQLHKGWINGGFLVMEPESIDLIRDDTIMLERGPMDTAAKQGELMAFCHDGFWYCIDTKRDYELLKNMWNSGTAPWLR